jgi:hypothetical protein
MSERFIRSHVAFLPALRLSLSKPEPFDKLRVIAGGNA